MKASVRIVTLLATAAVWLFASTSAALADSPVSSDWPAPADRSTLDFLLIFGGGTLALFVVVALFGLLTAHNNYVPPDPGTDLVPAADRSPSQH